MLDNAKGDYGIIMEFTTPDKLTMKVEIMPDEIFSYNTTKSKYLCSLIQL